MGTLIVGNRNRSAKQKNASGLETVLKKENLRFHCLGTRSGPELPPVLRALSPEIYPPSGLVSGLILSLD
jgi:hypothetical protein